VLARPRMRAPKEFSLKPAEGAASMLFADSRENTARSSPPRLF
jgi:hypothetical protein